MGSARDRQRYMDIIENIFPMKTYNFEKHGVRSCSLCLDQFKTGDQVRVMSCDCGKMEHVECDASDSSGAGIDLFYIDILQKYEQGKAGDNLGNKLRCLHCRKAKRIDGIK